MGKKIAIIGGGRVGGSVGCLLAKAGFAVAAIVCRTQASAEKARSFIGSGIATIDPAQAAAIAEIILITTPDSAIKTVCDSIAEAKAFRPGALVMHTSGAHTLDLLESAKRSGASRAVIHPLQSVPSMEQGAKHIPGSFFRIEADPEALAAAKELVQALGGAELALPKWRSDKQSAALYHAGAVAVSNYFVALIDCGLRFYQVLGADKQEALKAVLPLIKGTLTNMEALGTTEALTGPIARGDAETIKGHIEAMRERLPGLLPFYRELAKQTIAIARERGLDEKAAEELLKIVR